MPFTPAHAAAAIPFRRTRLIISAVVVGTFGPDLPYFARFGVHGRFGHTLPGIFLLDLPLCLIALWLFHTYAKQPLWAWLPAAVRRRVPLDPAATPFRAPAQYWLIVLSILTGIATHILWDSFTHSWYWPFRHWHLLRTTINVPLLGSIPFYAFLQLLSSAIGLLIALAWWLHWSRAASFPAQMENNHHPADRKVRLVAITIALIAGTIQAAIPFFSPRLWRSALVDAIVIAISVFWVELVIYGIIRRRALSRAQITQLH